MNGPWFGLEGNGKMALLYCYIASLNQHSVASSTVWDRDRERDRFLLFLRPSWISTVATLVFSALYLHQTSLSTEWVKSSPHVEPLKLTLHWQYPSYA